MFRKIKPVKDWNSGTYLISAESSFEAEIIESKLRSENIPCIKKYKGMSNFLEITMGQNMVEPIDIFVPHATLEDAENIISMDYEIMNEDNSYE